MALGRSSLWSALQNSSTTIIKDCKFHSKLYLTEPKAYLLQNIFQFLTAGSDQLKSYWLESNQESHKFWLEMILKLWNFMKCKIFIFFQYFLKEAFKFCGALLLHYVFWVKRKGKIDSNESYYRGLPAFIVPNWGFWISWRRRRMEFLLTQITSKACFFVNIFIQLFLCILFLKITILL